MNDTRLTNLNQIKAFLEGSHSLEFTGVSAKEKYPLG